MKPKEIKPTIIDLLKGCKRGPQVILPKDAAGIVAITGLRSGWKCLDAGGGSGWLALFLGNIVQPEGKVTTYEIRKEFASIIKENVTACMLEHVVEVKNKDVSKFSEKNLDMITLDMKGAETIVPKCRKALKPGGWLVIYSPYIEQQKVCIEEMKKSGFSEIQTIENIQRRWQVCNWTHPLPSGILHTGFLSFGRKTSDINTKRKMKTGC
jgi:tRNA (adenine57-N1/adenine58-N1)-methyltransferase